MTDNARQRDRKGTLAKLARFVLVVWAIGIAYKLLEHGELALTRTSLEAGVLDSGWAVPAPSDPGACDEVVAGLDRTAHETASRNSRSDAWRLGADLGRRRAILVEQTLGEGPQRLFPNEFGAMLAERLGVPLPKPPEARNPADVFNELSFHLVNDPDCVAARLAKLYGPDHADLYRFGAVAGQAVAYRELGLAQEASFAEIRYYGEQTAIPEKLWSRLVKPAGDDPEAMARQARDAAALIEGWLAVPDDPG